MVTLRIDQNDEITEWNTLNETKAVKEEKDGDLENLPWKHGNALWPWKSSVIKVSRFRFGVTPIMVEYVKKWIWNSLENSGVTPWVAPSKRFFLFCATLYFATGE